MRRCIGIGAYRFAAVAALLAGAGGCAASSAGFSDGGDRDGGATIPSLDTGTEHDSTSPTEAGSRPDATASSEAGSGHDAASAVDTGTTGDGTIAVEAGSQPDSGAKPDATSSSEAGPKGDSALEDGGSHEEASTKDASGDHTEAGSHKDGSAEDAGSSCSGPSQCPPTGTTCIVPGCANGMCDTANAPKGTTCTDHGGTECDGAGNCGLAPQGATCTSGATCATGHCVDGFCCNTACSGTCQACNAAQTGGTSGTCENVLAGNTAPAGQCTASACGNAGTCNAGACEQVATGTVCGSAATCTLGMQTTSGTCGAGACVAGQTTSCGAYDCNASASACLVHCSANTDCSSTANYCENPGTTTGTCVPKLANGASCTAGLQCVSGDCYGTPEICQANLCGNGIKDGLETGVDCGGPVCGICPTVLLVGAGSASSVGAELHPTTGTNGTWSSTTALSAPSVDDLGISISGSGAASKAVSVLRYTQMGAALDESLMFATWTPGATVLAGTWVPFAAVAAGVTALDVPGVSATSTTTTTFVSFQGTDYKHYFAAYANGAWSPTAEAVALTGGGQASGPTPAGVAAIGANATIAYFLNGSNQATSQDRTTTWQPPVTLDMLAADESYVSTPSIVAMNGGTSDLLTAFIRQSDGAILFAKRTTGTWSATAVVPGATAPSSTSAVQRVGLAALPSGNAILTWQDRTTSGIFYSLYTAGTWSTAPIALANPNVTVTSTPSVAHGVAGATAEMAFVASTGVAFHTRLVGGTWTTPASVGGTSLDHVSITSAP